MKGTNPSKEESQYHKDLCTIVGCIVCWVSRNTYNSHCLIHHIDGRTKPDAHKLVIPVCSPDHDYHSPINSIHKCKARFIKEHGYTELDFKELADLILIEAGCHVPVVQDRKGVLPHGIFNQGDCY